MGAALRLIPVTWPDTQVEARPRIPFLVGLIYVLRHLKPTCLRSFIYLSVFYILLYESLKWLYSQELEQQDEKLNFDISIKAVSILRYLTDHIKRFGIHLILSLMVNIM